MGYETRPAFLGHRVKFLGPVEGKQRSLESLGTVGTTVPYDGAPPLTDRPAGWTQRPLTKGMLPTPGRGKHARASSRKTLRGVGSKLPGREGSRGVRQNARAKRGSIIPTRKTVY